MVIWHQCSSLLLIFHNKVHESEILWKNYGEKINEKSIIQRILPGNKVWRVNRLDSIVIRPYMHSPIQSHLSVLTSVVNLLWILVGLVSKWAKKNVWKLCSLKIYGIFTWKMCRSLGKNPLCFYFNLICYLKTFDCLYLAVQVPFRKMLVITGSSIRTLHLEKLY